ncbi:hypothetical protein AB0K52_13525 [Glycomyces sp. NPDC049804]|uniref:hypothetical protein n=1 Tax=Glycomyces sp. NPDC049804 TaxID=3154363 RepID=UPI0034472BE0
MPDFDPEMIELVATIVGLFATLAATVLAAIQVRWIKRDRLDAQRLEAPPESSDRPKQTTDGKPTQ